MSNEMKNEELAEQELKDVSGGIQKKSEPSKDKELGDDEMKRVSGGVQKKQTADNHYGSKKSKESDRED
jgi:hypothetical protein